MRDLRRKSLTRTQAPAGWPIVARLRFTDVPLLMVLIVLAVNVAGCRASHYPPPPEPRRPTLIGIVSTGDRTDGVWTVTLEDGRRIEAPSYSVGFSGAFSRRDLYLEGTGGVGRWFETLDQALGFPGCWKGPKDLIVWDLGASVMFQDGLDLPKAATFEERQHPGLIDGRKAWAQDTYVGVRFCINEKGEVAYVAV